LVLCQKLHIWTTDVETFLKSFFILVTFLRFCVFHFLNVFIIKQAASVTKRNNIGSYTPGIVAAAGYFLGI